MNSLYVPIFIFSILITLCLLFYVLKKQSKSQMKTIFILNITLVLILSISVFLQLLFSEKLNIDPIIFEYFSYIGGCFLPVTVFLTGQIFVNTKIKFSRKYLLLFIIPIISLLVLWTNDYHHLFFEKYSVNMNEGEFGPYMTINNIYSYLMLFIGIMYLLRFSIKNSGFFSKQSLLIVLGISVPIVVNILGTFKIIPMTIYITPITFTVAIFCFALAILKFQFLGVAPIALQKIVDRISDGFIVINSDGTISDYNNTFISIFNLKNVQSKNGLRNKNFIELLNKYKEYEIDVKKFEDAIEKVRNNSDTIIFEQEIKKINKWFTIEVNTISNKGDILGTLILFKDITQHILDMKQIQDSQETLMEKERLASLGQLIGGIAHNLKTPIMSISGAAEGLNDLIKEYDSSIEDPEVNSDDHHDIAKDMSSWVSKIKTHTEYMSDVITAVKGQAVNLSNEQDISFTVEELIKRVNILMKHELKNAIIYLNIQMLTDQNTLINGDVNSLVQVINNMISNSIQAYNGKTEQNIDLIVEKDKNNLIISIKDYASGMSEKVKNKLFKEMITTKGKNGTGLGLYMSYSTIRAHFNGNILVESEQGKGTTFSILLPLK